MQTKKRVHPVDAYLNMSHHSCQTLAGGMEMETVRLSGKGTFVLPEVIRDLHKGGLLSLAYVLQLNGFTMFVVR